MSDQSFNPDVIRCKSDDTTPILKEKLSIHKSKIKLIKTHCDRVSTANKNHWKNKHTWSSREPTVWEANAKKAFQGDGNGHVH